MGRYKEFERNDVLDKATQLFWQKGLTDTTLHDIEHITGLSKSSLYAEFKDKENLFIHCLKRYAETNGVLETLSQSPLGLANIKKFLLAGQNHSGQKGCFFANCMREISILPSPAKVEIEKHTLEIKTAIAKNLKAISSVKGASVKGDADLVADIILTFSSGVALQLNTGKVSRLEKIIDHLLTNLFPTSTS